MPSKSPTATRLRIVLRATGLLLLLLASLALSIVAFFASALAVDSPVALAVAAALVLLAASFASAWWCAPGLGWATARRAPFAGGLAALTFVPVASAAWLLVFRPLAPDGALASSAADGPSWVLATGSRLAYEVRRAAPGARRAPLVYLHGGPAVPPRGSVGTFLAPLTGDGFDVYVYDQFGSGKSGRAPHIAEYTLARHVADLDAVREHLGAEKLILVGSSWGAVLAGYYMAAHPGRVERAVLLSPGVLAEREAHPYDFSLSASSDAPGVLLPPMRMIVAGTLARLNPALAESFATEAELGAEFDRFTAGPDLEYQTHCKGRFDPAARPAGPSRARGGNYYANLITLQSLRQAPDPRPALQAVQAPVLLLRGDCDYVPWSSAVAWRRALPAATLARVPDAGHALTAGAPAVTFGALRAFLQDEPLVLPVWEPGSP